MILCCIAFACCYNFIFALWATFITYKDVNKQTIKSVVESIMQVINAVNAVNAVNSTICKKDADAALILCAMSLRPAAVFGIPMYVSSKCLQTSCACCNTSKTSMWRRGWPLHTLYGVEMRSNVCNACGLKLTKK